MTLLQVQNVSRHFGSLIAVNEVSLTVEPGELRAVIGPNGAGKTTFFNLISGFFPPTSGRILLDGREITKLPAHRRVAMGMARTFQRICASRLRSRAAFAFGPSCRARPRKRWKRASPS